MNKNERLAHLEATTAELTNKIAELTNKVQHLCAMNDLLLYGHYVSTPQLPSCRNARWLARCGLQLGHAGSHRDVVNDFRMEWD